MVCERDNLTNPEARFNSYIVFFALRTAENPNPRRVLPFPPCPCSEAHISSPRQSSLGPGHGLPDRDASGGKGWVIQTWPFLAAKQSFWTVTVWLCFYGWFWFWFWVCFWWSSCETSVESSDRFQVDKGEQGSDCCQHKEQELHC